MPNWHKLTDTVIEQFQAGDRYNPQMLRAFVEANKLNAASRSWPQDYAKLLKDGRFPYNSKKIEQNMPPYLDHTTIFKNTETGLMCLTYQPYKEAAENSSEIEQWASENGLVAEIYDPEYSWYYPGETYLVVIHSPETVISADCLKAKIDIA